MKYLIHRVEMTQPHYYIGGNSRRMVVMHATAGSYPSDYEWLRHGGDPAAPVSTHYYISPSGEITQFVHDTDRAWHAGASSWIVYGVQTSHLNDHSIGIELSHPNTFTPHDARQLDAAVWLVQKLVSEYGIPQSQLVRHSDIAPGRKSDPQGLDWDAFVSAVYGPPPERRAPHWYVVPDDITAAYVRYAPEVPVPPSANVAQILMPGSRLHIAEWCDWTDEAYGGQWGRLSESTYYVHSSGVVAE
jgi:hypothetical protein